MKNDLNMSENKDEDNNGMSVYACVGKNGHFLFSFDDEQRYLHDQV